jgi:predicted transcriptional regulator
MAYTLPPRVNDNLISDRLRSEIYLLERHIKMLKLIRDEGPMGIIKLAERTSFPQHKVRYSLRILEEAGLIHPSPRGAMITDKADEFVLDFSDLLVELESKIDTLKQML